MHELKIVVTGCVGAGKTTAIAALSDIPVIATDVDATDEVASEKQTTTVALDYGEVTLDDGAVVKLYGTPGQGRFAYMWDILADGALGVVILVNDRRPDPVADLRGYLDSFEGHIRRSVAVIGVTHVAPESGEPAMAKYYDFLGGLGLDHPVFSIDARDRAQVRLLIETMAAIIAAGEARAEP